MNNKADAAVRDRNMNERPTEMKMEARERFYAYQ
jgi:hypothetical protein